MFTHIHDNHVKSSFWNKRNFINENNLDVKKKDSQYN